MSEAIKGLYQRYCNETDLIIKAALKAQLNFHGVEVVD